jgi:acyl CoA:acetate/3-ketoacid CoA transferase beta subunit
MAILDFEPKSKRMRIASINPGYSEKDVRENCGFELLTAPKVADTKPPTDEELHILRDEVDPNKLIIGR